MDAPDLLIRRARDYEFLAASHAERAGLERRSEHMATATAFIVAAIVLREVAAALDGDAAA